MTQTVPTVGNYYFAACENEVFNDNCLNVSSSDVNVSVVFNPSYSGAYGQLNYLEVNAKRSLTMFGAQMEFGNADTTGPGNVTEYTLNGASSALKIWDVTDPVHVREQQGTLSGTSFIFRMPSDSLREFMAYTGSSFITPLPEGKVENQNLHLI